MPKIVVDTTEVLSPIDAARRLSIGYATLYRWIKAGKIFSLRLSGRTFIPVSEIERMRKDPEGKQP